MDVSIQEGRIGYMGTEGLWYVTKGTNSCTATAAQIMDKGKGSTIPAQRGFETQGWQVSDHSIKELSFGRFKLNALFQKKGA